MAVTRSSTVDRPKLGRTSTTWRATELVGTLAAALLVAFGLHLVYQAKSIGLPEVDQGLTAKRLLNLNGLTSREDLLPALTEIADVHAREEAARQIYYVAGSLSNVGALARIHGLFTSEQFRQLKPLFVVRRPAQFRSAFYQWSLLFLGSFLLVHLWWSFRNFRGDQLLLPAVMLLTGAGFDPHDRPARSSARQPVICRFRARRRRRLPAAGSDEHAGLPAPHGQAELRPVAGQLCTFGSSGGVRAWTGHQRCQGEFAGVSAGGNHPPVAGAFPGRYFAQRWDVLRHARETRPRLAALTSRVDIPPVEYSLPALVCALLSVLFFFLQRDMGPALVFASLFLVLYGMARGSVVVPVVGLTLVVAGFFAGYVIGVPHTVSERVSMWLSPWDNHVHGGDQLAHSLWAYATGGPTGMGTGLGDPQLVPAAHTDLILSALGEEWGFVGIAGIFALYGLLIWRAFRIALRARNDYEFFLAAGLAAATALQFLLIAGGSLGVVPLSGVVTPFLSYGRTAMLANFVVIAMLESISHRGRRDEADTPFRGVTLAMGAIFALAGAVVLAKAGYVQVARSAAVMGEGTLVIQADGARRYQYNPRFQEIIRAITKGTIYDRNGLPLATSNWDDLEKHRADYKALGIDIDRACPRSDSRYYPFGGVMFDLLGDLRTRLRWAASNTAFVERDEARRLRGYDDRPTLEEVKGAGGKVTRVIRYDYRELVPLLRHRYEPNNPEVRKVMDRKRDVRMSIDARLQMQVAAILTNQLKTAGKDKGAAVVMDPATGDLLAAVSIPWPTETEAGDQPEAPGAISTALGTACIRRGPRSKW